MKKIYSFPKSSALLSVCVSLLLANSHAYSQDPSQCGQVIENFNNTAGSTAGFTGSFALATAGTNGYLSKDKILSFAQYSLTTPTYQLAANQTTVGFGFTLGGTVNVARVSVGVQYTSTTTNEVITVPVSPEVTPQYDSQTGTSDVCGSVSFANLPGFPTGGRYRLVFNFFPATGTGLTTETITVDDYRTNGTASQIPLPVVFMSFEAKKEGSNVLLSWKVAGEENVARYEVERSEDGRSFRTIGSVNSHGKDIYTYIDGASSSTVFYRIKNVDNDGKSKFSAIARITNGRSEIVLRAFPQPVQNQLTVQHPTIGDGATISVSSADGRVVRTIVPGAGSIQTVVDMSNLQKGMYMIRFTGGDGKVETMKVLKQ